jgi:hypothetical protein
MTPHTKTKSDRPRNVSLKLSHKEYHNLKKLAYANMNTISQHIRLTLCQTPKKN